MAAGVRSMIRMAVRGSSWSQFFDYASPALFDVIPARELLSQSRELISNRRDAIRFNAVREQIGTILRHRRIDVQLTDGPSARNETVLSALPESSRHEVGRWILEIYFTQLFASPEALLDLRSHKFTRTDQGGLCWRPGALYVRWHPEFLDGVAGLYRGFYLDDEARFEAALQQLNMEGSGGALRNLLGRDDPRNARFDLQSFHSNFHELFVSYRDRRVSLHRNFLPLGLCLMGLYEALDSLGVELDVRDVVSHACSPTEASK